MRAPTLVLHARADLRIPFDQGRALAAHISGARFVSLDSRNHILLPHEPAWAQLVAELEAFLATPVALAGSPLDTTAGARLAGLTAKEQAVLNILAQGLATPAMAQRLGISEKTLRNHLSIIYSKLGVANRAQATVLAREHGLARS